MITIYIDESGTKSITNLEQPVFLFSAVCIKTNIFSNVESEMTSIIHKTKQLIKTKLYFALNDNRYTSNRASRAADILEDLLLKDFELHCSELIRGDNEFIILKEHDRIKIVKDVLNLISSNNIKVITSLCAKEEFRNKHAEKDTKQIEKDMHETIVEQLIDSICKYLEEEDDCACIIADEGNEIIEKILIPKLKFLESERLTPEVLEKSSNKSVCIQMADICAYVNNMKKRASILEHYNKKQLAKELSELIEENSINLDVNLEVHAINF